MGSTPLCRSPSGRRTSERAVADHRRGDGRESRSEHPPTLHRALRGLKAAYTFFDRPEANPERLQSKHREELFHERLSEVPGTYLLLEDGSEISFSGMNKPIEGLGFIGDGQEGLRGFLLHSVLAVRWPGQEEGAREKSGKEEKRPPVEVLGLQRFSQTLIH